MAIEDRETRGPEARVSTTGRASEGGLGGLGSSQRDRKEVGTLNDILVTSPGSTVYRLPRSHWHCTFENFEWDAVRPRVLRPRIEEFLERVVAGEAPHALLTGDPGIGKSHVGVAAYRWAAARLGTALTTWINVPDLCETVKTSYGGQDAGTWEDVEGARRLVVLDDLFGRNLSVHEASQIVYRLIDTAYRNNAAVMASMNQSVEELTRRLPAHEISRLLADSMIVPLSADKDWRR